jgi:hypothetical protein
MVEQDRGEEQTGDLDEVASSDAGGTEDDEEGLSDEFSDRVLDSMREIFWQPEIERRGGSEATGEVYQALAIMRPGQAVEVLFNDEFKLVARAEANTDVAKGDPVTLENMGAIEGIEPVGVDPNAGWAAWLVLPDGRQFMQFDFIRNRGHSLRLLALARDYLATADHAADAGLAGPVVENAMAAAELAVTAQTYSFSTDPVEKGGGRNTHSARQHWTKVHAGLGNTTSDAHATLVTLHRLRAAARYGEGELPTPEEARGLLEAVHRLVEDAAGRVGSLLRTQDPDFIAELEASTSS